MIKVEKNHLLFTRFSLIFGITSQVLFRTHEEVHINLIVCGSVVMYRYQDGNLLS
jgi:hypothetical protein